jgi:CPA2 family monovalent cation:H+ antiporter-2
MKVGGTASITAVTQIIVMVLMGFLVGTWMGWKQMDSIFLGTFCFLNHHYFKTFDELGVKAQNLLVL